MIFDTSVGCANTVSPMVSADVKYCWNSSSVIVKASASLSKPFCPFSSGMNVFSALFCDSPSKSLIVLSYSKAFKRWMATEPGSIAPGALPPSS